MRRGSGQSKVKHLREETEARVDLDQPVAKKSAHLPRQVPPAVHKVRVREGCLQWGPPLANRSRVKLREAYLNSLEVVKYLNDILTGRHGVLGVVSVQVFRYGGTGLLRQRVP